MKLADLAKQHPSEKELANFPEILEKESDRSAAIMAAALVELALRDNIRTRLVDPGGGIDATWFEGPNAPFQSFSAKITLGRALGIYGPAMEKRLVTIKNIRNAFAHSVRPLDFEHSTLQSQKANLTTNFERDKDASMSLLFGASCLAISSALGRDAVNRGGKEIKVTFD